MIRFSILNILIISLRHVYVWCLCELMSRFISLKENKLAINIILWEMGNIYLRPNGNTIFLNSKPAITEISRNIALGIYANNQHNKSFRAPLIPCTLHFILLWMNDKLPRVKEFFVNRKFTMHFECTALPKQLS